MALRDYETEDEEDFYGQSFQVEGKVSVWVTTMDLDELPDETDILQDLCGVGYYDPSFQDVVTTESEQPIPQLLKQGISYYRSFQDEVAKASSQKAKLILAQFDFAYDPTLVKRPIDARIVFLGVFDYEKG